jgi:hypothetical protein
MLGASTGIWKAYMHAAAGQTSVDSWQATLFKYSKHSDAKRNKI